MPERLLSGADARFSDCFLAMNYRYRGRQRLTDPQQNAIDNIQKNTFNAPIVDEISPLEELIDRFNIGKAGNFTYSVLIDLEQTPAENVSKAVDETVKFFSGLANVNFIDVIIATVSGNKIGVQNKVLPRKGVNCEFGFIFRFTSDKQWDREFLRNNRIVLAERNPNVRKIVDIENDVIREDDFIINPQDELVIQFTIEQNEITIDEIVAITNAVEGFAEKAVVDSRRGKSDTETIRRLLTMV